MQQQQCISNFNQLNMFRAIISPILRSTRLCLQLVLKCTEEVACWWHQQAAATCFCSYINHHQTVQGIQEGVKDSRARNTIEE